MSPETKKRLTLAAKALLVVGILSYLFYDIGKDGKLAELIQSPKQWSWVSIGLVACVAAHLFGFVRWQLMVRALGLPFSVLDSIRIGLIGLFFGLFAFGVVGGDTLRAFYVTREVKNRTPEAITSVLADRLIGILTMFMIASVAFCFFDPTAVGDSAKLSGIRFLGWFVVTCTLLGIAGLVFLYFLPYLMGMRLVRRILEIPKVGDLIKRLVDVLSLYRCRLGTIAIAFLLSVGVNVCFAISIYSLAVGLTSGNPGFLDHFIIEPIAMVSNAIPVPGGIGTMEMAMKYLYLAFGSENGVIIGFAYRFALLSVSALGALVWFWNKDQVEKLTTETVAV
ncbi:MAG: lysylphosphatidylglycerol synthase transmembrane domain-containing protein [Planctomycetota bacterium]